MAAEKNLFEKYGIKEVADVTFYRIDRQKETYESQRKITAASILKGAVELKTVYPNDGTGVGAEEGFEASSAGEMSWSEVLTQSAGVRTEIVLLSMRSFCARILYLPSAFLTRWFHGQALT